MRARPFILLLAVLGLVGCDRISGVADQKVADAEAIGYACRVSQKKPEDCMKENEAQSPSSMLDGWKAADKDIKEKKINADMTNHAPVSEPTDAASGVPATEAGKTIEDKATEKHADAPATKAEAADTHKPAAH